MSQYDWQDRQFTLLVLGNRKVRCQASDSSRCTITAKFNVVLFRGKVNHDMPFNSANG
jgi:hypothetical protein